MAAIRFCILAMLCTCIFVQASGFLINVHQSYSHSEQSLGSNFEISWNVDSGHSIQDCHGWSYRVVPHSDCIDLEYCSGNLIITKSACAPDLAWATDAELCVPRDMVDLTTCRTKLGSAPTTTKTTLRTTQIPLTKQPTTSAPTTTTPTTTPTTSTATTSAATQTTTTTTTTATTVKPTTPNQTTPPPYDHCYNFTCEHGACMVLNAQPSCACVAGYHGKRCELATRTTTSSPTTTTTPSTTTTGFPAAWSSWIFTPCSVTCGTGSKQGLRRCSSGHEEDCPGVSYVTEDCMETPCPVDGGWSAWISWSSCSNTCGNNGTTTRQRSCHNPSPSFGGKGCSGVASETEACNIIECPHWSPWFFTPCSVTCGTGSKDGIRRCSSGQEGDCPGSAVTTEICHESPCADDSGWGNWLAWSECSITCGDGTKMRVRLCDSTGPTNCQGNFQQMATCKSIDCP